MNSKICISIPIHEKADVVIDQINNIKHFYLDDVYIVLHVSLNHVLDFHMLNEIKKIENVFINSESLFVQWGTLMHVHNSNFKFAKNILNFDYFVLHSSNDMYVNFGARQYIEKAKNGVMQLERTKNINYLINDENGSYWSPKRYIDKEFNSMMKYLGIDKVMGTQPEGIFFQKEIFEEMVNTADIFYVYGREKIYPREEYWYSTMIQKFVDKIYSPFLLSEVYSSVIKENDSKLEIKDKFTYVGDNISKEIILNLNSGQSIDNLIIFDQFYDCSNLYAVKRIARDINDEKRMLIRGFTEKQKKDS